MRLCAIFLTTAFFGGAATVPMALRDRGVALAVAGTGVSAMITSRASRDKPGRRNLRRRDRVIETHGIGIERIQNHVAPVRIVKMAEISSVWIGNDRGLDSPQDVWVSCHPSRIVA